MLEEEQIMGVIDKYFGSSLVKQFVIHYEQVCNKYCQDSRLIYFGVNFDEQGLYSVKFYFHIFPVLRKDDVELFLPVSKDYLHYIEHYDGINNQGCAFEIKFQKGKEHPTIGFHYRLTADSKSFQLVGKPKFIDQIDLQHGPGINYEYTGEEVYVKRYFYFTGVAFKQYFSERFDLPLLTETNLIEFSESDIMSKINIWFGVDNAHLIEEANLFTSAEKQCTNKIVDRYNVEMKACGLYENKKMKAVYFFRNLSNEGVQNSNIFS